MDQEPFELTDSRVDDFYAFIRMREAIRLRRASGMLPPWTDDEILQKFKFTNIKREHDRTSIQLIQEFYRPFAVASREEILMNAAIFRYFGTIEFARAVGWQSANRSLKQVAEIARNRMLSGQRVYTGAYIVTSGNRAGPKEQTICYIYLYPLQRQLTDIVAAALENNSWEQMHARLCLIDGFGPFIAKEVILDTMYTDFWPDGRPADWQTWTPIGPGAKRGACRLLGRPGRAHRKGRYRADISAAAALEVCMALYAARTGRWPTNWVPLDLHDIQFQLCEFDKYERVRLGQGRPRSLFKPRED